MMGEVRTTKVGDGSLVEDAEFYGLDKRRPWRYVLEFEHEDFGGAVVEDDDGAALVWNDFVVNNWTELYSSLPLAMMRFALLMHAAETEYPKWFKTSDPHEFTREAIGFFEENLTVG